MGEIQDGSAVFTVRDKRAQALFDFVYPVGIVVALANDKKPTFMNYGTWEKVAEDRVLQGSSESNAPGKKIEPGLPNITGILYQGYGNGENGIGLHGDNGNPTGAFYKAKSTASAPSVQGYSGVYTPGFDASRSNDIYGNSETVQPPAYVVAYWQRTA